MHARGFAALLVLAATALPNVSAHAQEWPSRPIRMIMPFGGGGPGESVMRPMMDHLQKALGQAVVGENRPGAGGTTGALAVARSAPDGYTLLYGTNSPFSVGPVIYAKAGYSAASFEPVVLIYQVPFVLSVSKKSGINSMAELVTAAKRAPAEFSFASVGLGTTTHLLAELVNIQTGTTIAHVPYRGPSLAIADLVAGQVQMFIDGISNMAPQHQGGTVKTIMVLDTKRAPTLPDVQSAAEAGFPNMVAYLWSGLAAPAGTPREIVERLNREVNVALGNAEVRASSAKLGIEVIGGPPSRLGERIATETKVWSEIAERARIKID